MVRNEELRERYKSPVNAVFQATWIGITVTGLGFALSHLPWALSVPVIVFCIIVALQMWARWDEPAGDC